MHGIPINAVAMCTGYTLRPLFDVASAVGFQGVDGHIQRTACSCEYTAMHNGCSVAPRGIPGFWRPNLRWSRYDVHPIHIAGNSMCIWCSLSPGNTAFSGGFFTGESLRRLHKRRDQHESSQSHGHALSMWFSLTLSGTMQRGLLHGHIPT